MSEEVDNGVEEQLGSSVRAAFVAASQLVQMMMTRRQQAAKADQRDSEATARELGARFDAELVAAEAHLQQVNDPQWWTTASVEDIGQAYGTAQAWSEQSRLATTTTTLMEGEVRSRYGAEIKDLLDEAAIDHQDADVQRVREQQDRAEAERLAAGELTSRGDQVAGDGSDELLADDRSASASRGDLAYDSAERRAGTAADLEAAGYDKQAVAARMTADVSNAEPAKAAVRTGKKGPVRARSRAGGAGLDAGRDVGSR